MSRSEDARDGAAASAPVATAARYHPASGRVIVELGNGAMIAFPTQLVAGLNGATPAALAAVEIVDGGHVLHWASAGVYLPLLTVLTDILGARAQLKRLAGPALRRAERRGADDGGRRPPRW